MEESSVVQSNFVQVIGASVKKKEGLFDQSKARYFVRSMYAGAMLVFATAAGVYAADYLNVGAPHVGKFAYALLFPFGLAFILFLHQELVTSNMMYLTAGTYHRFISVGKSVQILLFCTLGNLLGALLAAALIAHTGAFSQLTAENFIVATVEGKLGKGLGQVFIEAIAANIYVNLAILGYLLAKNEVAKLFIVFGAIFMFVFLGFEHVVANFGSVGLVLFSNYSLSSMAASTIIFAWLVAWIGNYIGGGLLLGLVYAWLNENGMPLND